MTKLMMNIFNFNAAKILLGIIGPLTHKSTNELFSNDNLVISIFDQLIVEDFWLKSKSGGFLLSFGVLITLFPIILPFR